MKNTDLRLRERDWRGNMALQSTSCAARGLWVEMLWLMQQGTPYGYLAINGKGIRPGMLARLVAADVEVVTVALAELEDAGLFQRADDGTIYSAQMVRDEEIRAKRAAGGKKGGNPLLLQAKAERAANPAGEKKGKKKKAEPETPAVDVDGHRVSELVAAYCEVHKAAYNEPATGTPRIAGQIRNWLAGGVEVTVERFRQNAEKYIRLCAKGSGSWLAGSDTSCGHFLAIYDNVVSAKESKPAGEKVTEEAHDPSAWIKANYSQGRVVPYPGEPGYEEYMAATAAKEEADRIRGEQFLAEFKRKKELSERLEAERLQRERARVPTAEDFAAYDAAVAEDERLTAQLEAAGALPELDDTLDMDSRLEILRRAVATLPAEPAKPKPFWASVYNPDAEKSAATGG